METKTAILELRKRRHWSQDELAEKLGTINYEITCMISRRVPRFYIQNNKMKFYKSYLSDLAISMYNI